MRLESVRDLKQQLLNEVILPAAARATAARAAGRGGDERTPAVFGIGARPFDTVPRIHRSVALGVARRNRDYRLAIRVQRPMLMAAPLLERLVRTARGEADVRLIGRIDKRGRSPRRDNAPEMVPWYRTDTRPLLIGASIGHMGVTAGTLGAFARRGDRIYVLSNNHVLANEDQAKSGDWILQRAAYDGGREPSERVARLRHWIRLKRRRPNVVDAALAEILPGVAYEPGLLRDLIHGQDRRLAGVRAELIDEGESVYKLGRTTGGTEGRVTAFDVDNVVVNYDAGNLRFDNQIEIEGVGQGPFTDGGDSGSLVVDRGMRAVALVFAGGDTGGANGLGLTYANPLGRVLTALRAALLS
jgi:hypothetical protein